MDKILKSLIQYVFKKFQECAVPAKVVKCDIVGIEQLVTYILRIDKTIFDRLLEFLLTKISYRVIALRKL